MPYTTSRPSPIIKPAGSFEPTTGDRFRNFVRDNVPVVLFAAAQAGRRAIGAFNEWSAGNSIDPAYARALGVTAVAPNEMTIESLEAFGQLSPDTQDQHFALAAAEEHSLVAHAFSLTSELDDVANARVAAMPTQPGYSPTNS